MSVFSTLDRRVRRVRHAVRVWNKVPYFGFVQGHAHLTDGDVRRLQQALGRNMSEAVEAFERQFAALIGDGDAVAFASARMAFFVLMQEIGIREGDEVVLPGATCSVMANAVLRVGARPVYADLDPRTLAPDAVAVEKVISPRTRMIVAQHSFGIPCDIEGITELARSRNLFLLEDCALTLGSRFQGKVAGSFGHAALFSTDHSKPLNTMMGGLVYSPDRQLIARIRRRREKVSDVPLAKQRALFRRLLLERAYCHPGRYGRLALRELVERLTGARASPFLDEDFGCGSGTSYPYPARMPGFLALLGLLELKRWPRVAARRKEVLRRLLGTAERLGMDMKCFEAYQDERRDVVPLRLAWHAPDGERQRGALADRVDVSWTWFMQPIVATREPLEAYGYHRGACPVSESLGPRMINLPCNIPVEWVGELAKCLRRIVPNKDKEDSVVFC